MSSPATPHVHDQVTAEIEARSAALPFWRRPRRLRRQITGVLVATALVAVALFGALNYVAADRLLLNGTKDLLASQAHTRAQSTERGAVRLLSRVSSTASDRGLVVALDAFSTGFVDLADTELDPAQSAELDRAYQERVVAPINELGVTQVSLADVVPDSNAGRWVQFHYTLPAVTGVPAPTSGDATTYDLAVADYDPYLTSLSDTFGGGDLLLIDRDGVVVYSTEKHIDLGTSLTSGPYAESALGNLVRDGLGSVRAGDAVLTNFSVYVPRGARPVLFSAASIRDGNEVVGTVAVEIPVAALDNITVGQDSGSKALDHVESYIVSSDLLLQSTPSTWIEDPSGYLAGIADPEVRRVVEALGSPVGVQTIDTAPVRAALDGTQFAGSATNAAGQRSYSSSTSIDVPGVTWVVVTDVPLAVARTPLFTYLKRMALVAAIVLLGATLIGFLLARRLTRPIPIAVSAAQAVAEGERHLHLPPRGNDEFGDLGRRLTLMASRLDRQEQALAEEYERKRELLLTVLPPELVRGDGVVSGTGGRFQTASVIAVAIDADPDGLDEDLTSVLASVGEIAERLASEREIERVRVAADRSLFVAGNNGADVALDFASSLSRELQTFADDAGLTMALHIGVSTGEVATGVLARGSLTFAAWGEPVRRALAISALSDANEVLVDQSTIDATSGAWSYERADDVVGLDDQPISVGRLSLVSAGGPATS